MNYKVILGKKLFGLSHKNSGILYGVMAQMLLVKGAISFIENPIFNGFSVMYAFCILLPMSYYNMRYYEIQEKPWEL